MELVIKPKNKWWELNWSELWVYRDLFYFFTWRDIKVKYKQTVIGALWAVFQPFITMVVFTIFFGKFAKMPSDGIPYPVFVYTGLIFWTLFSNSLAQVSNIFTDNERLVTKVYFPRIILPVSSIFTNIVDFLIASVILLAMMVYYHYIPSLISILVFPLLILITIFSILGIGILFASLNVKYRDIRFVLPFFMQLLIFVTPVIYPISLISSRFRFIIGLNPMAGVISTARVVILGVGQIDWLLLTISIFSMIVYCILGYLYFKKVEKYFADVI